MSVSLISVFEDVVERAWKEENIFSKKIFGNSLKRTDNVCQGISRNVFHKVFGCFPNSTMLKFRVKEKSHIVVYIAREGTSYVIDGAIKQFLENEERTVFKHFEYPLKKELQNSERFLV